MQCIFLLNLINLQINLSSPHPKFPSAFLPKWADHFKNTDRGVSDFSVNFEIINIQSYIEIDIMHKKKQTPILKSLKNPNAFKKKSFKILRELSPTPNFSLQTPKKEGKVSDMSKMKMKTERDRAISSEYNLNYNCPIKGNMSNGRSEEKSYRSRQNYKDPKLVLNSALDVQFEEKNMGWTEKAKYKKIKRNLSISGSESATNKEYCLLKNNCEKKKNSIYCKTIEQTYKLEQTVQELEKKKKKSMKMVINLFQKLKLREDKLEEERERFKVRKGIYLEQIRKLTQKLFGNDIRNSNFPIKVSANKYDEQKLTKKLHYIKRKRVESQ